MEDLKCPLCECSYDETSRVPLMIPDCGHTFCRSCIEKQISNLNGNSFLCPEDNVVCLHRTHITQFPVNCVLLKILTKQRRSNKTNYDTIPLQTFSRQTTKPDEESIQCKVPIQGYCTLQSDVVQDENPIDLCPEHFQRLDIVCLTDRAKICTKCALFGAHKQHDFRSVEDVVKDVTQKAEHIMHIYQQIQTKQTDLHEQRWFDVMSEKFRSALRDSQQAVKEKFNDLHQILAQKEQKFYEQLNQIISTLEQQSRRQISEMINQCSSSVELWKITAKDRLLYFSQTTEAGEIPLDLYNSDFSCLEKGQKIMEEIDRTLQSVEQKGQNIKIKKLRVDFKRKEFEKSIDSFFSLTLQMNSINSNSQQTDTIPQQNNQGDQSVRLQRGESLSKILQGDIFSSFCCDDPMLLKDVSLADWSEINGEMDCTQDSHQILSKPLLEKNQSSTPQKLQLDVRKNTSSFKLVEKAEKRSQENSQKHSFESSTQMNFQNSPANKNASQKIEDVNKILQQVTSIRSGVSPTPKLPIDKKKKTFKINEKFDQLWQQTRADAVETADFSNAELQDEGVFQLCEMLKVSKKLKTLKVVRNRITDDGVCKILDALLANPYQQFFSLHVQSNLITEKTLDYYMQLMKTYPNQGSLPKSFYLNQNLINCTKTKKKLEEIRKLGLTVTV